MKLLIIITLYVKNVKIIIVNVMKLMRLEYLIIMMVVYKNKFYVKNV